MASMDWLPPRSLAARSQWVKARPWLAACYLATFSSIFMAFVFPLLADGPASVRFKVTLGLVMWPVTVPLFHAGLKRGWGERPDAETSPPPTARRMWSRASDRMGLPSLWLTPDV